MAQTAAERQRKRRQKLREAGKYDDYRKCQTNFNRKCRDKKKTKENDLSQSVKSKLQRDTREAVRTRVAKCRAAKKVKQQTTVQDSSSAFKSAVAFGKATYRARRALQYALPSTPKRKKAVMRKLYTSLSPEKEQLDNIHEHKNAIPADHIDAVKLFYQRDDISRQAPGRKDAVTVREEDGSKAKYQARHLTSSLIETHALFNDEFPSIKVGKSKFAELRPQHVLLSSKLPHNVCLCRYHENFISAINTLHKAEPSIPLYTHDLPQTFLCNPPRRECWFNECDICGEGKGFRAVCLIDEASFVTWTVWKNDNDGKLGKIVQDGTTGDLMDYICSIIPKFMEHCFIKRMQAGSYNKEREAAEQSENNKALLQIDFSENYTCVSQDEIQSAHWKQSQVSLFTAALWYSGTLHPIVLTSDNLNHSKDTVVAYIACLLEELPDSVTKVSIWSDGPASQFKNRFILAALKPLGEKYSVQITRNFFATSHGKGPVDGIGGAVKRVVWNCVRNRKNHVTNATSFTEAASASNVKVIEIKSLKIDKINKSLALAKVFEDATAIPGIASVHYMRQDNGKPVHFILSSDAKEDWDDNIRNITVGDWCSVEYEGVIYPGEVKTIDDDDYQVSVMVPAGKNWRWPTSPDEIFYPRRKLLKRLKPPFIINHRGHFGFLNL